MKTLTALLLGMSLSAAALVHAQGQSGDEIARRQALERYRSGQQFMFMERYPEAQREFSAAVELDPLLTLARYGLGQSLMAQKLYGQAVQAFIGCREAYGKLAALRQSDMMASDRRMDEERRELRDSISRVRSGQIKGAGEALLQQLEKRLEELETMRRGSGADRQQTPAEVSLALGSAYYRNGQRDDAEREWRAAVTTNAKLGEAHNNLAVLYLTSGRKAEAEAALKAAEKARFRVNPQLKANIQKMQ